MKHLGNTSTLEKPIHQSLISRVTRSLPAAWNVLCDVHGRWHREAVERKALAELRAMDDRQLADIGVIRSDLYGLSKGLFCAPEVTR